MLREFSNTLKAGDRAPAFGLPTAASETVQLSDFRGKCVLVVFIRGTWCPNCTRQMAQFESSFPEFQRREIKVVFIAAQRRDGLFRGKQFMEKQRYPFPVLFDESRTVTRAYGVHHALGLDAVNLAKRSVFLVDGGGVIRWIAVSPHQWEAPGIDDILRVIEACDRC